MSEAQGVRCRRCRGTGVDPEASGSCIVCGGSGREAADDDEMTHEEQAVQDRRSVGNGHGW